MDGLFTTLSKFKIETNKREEFVDITSRVQQLISSSSISSGLCVLYCPHTTAALTINEGADPDVAKDIVKGLAKLIPRDWPFAHMEGNSDAHLKASMIGPSLTVLIEGGNLDSSIILSRGFGESRSEARKALRSRVITPKTRPYE